MMVHFKNPGCSFRGLWMAAPFLFLQLRRPLLSFYSPSLLLRFIIMILLLFFFSFFFFFFFCFCIGRAETFSDSAA